MSLNQLFVVIMVVAVPLIAWGLVSELYHFRFKQSLYSRRDATSDWEARFPDAMPVVDQVLTVFCEAFLLKDHYKSHLRTDDRVLAVYRNTTGPVADEMQIEALSMRLDDRFGFDLAEILNEETTLADLVDAMLNKPSSTKGSHATQPVVRPEPPIWPELNSNADCGGLVSLNAPSIRSRRLPTNDPIIHKSRFRFSLKTMLLVFTLLTVIVGGAFSFLRMIEQTVMDSYRVWGTGDMLVEYMKQNNGQWPKEWSDVQEFMANNSFQHAGMSSFAEVRRHIEIDFSFDPASVDTTIDFDESEPSFRAVWLRNGKTTRYEGTGPNEIIFRYLKSQASVNQLPSTQGESEPSIEPKPTARSN
jgi:hypothetical protein